jgi:hypothetical protein
MMPLKMPYLREEDGTNPSINVCFILIIEDQLICKNIIRSFSFDFVTSNPKCSTYGIWEDIITSGLFGGLKMHGTPCLLSMVWFPNTYQRGKNKNTFP